MDDRESKSRSDSDVLNGMIALLLSLARLADRVTLRSLPIRCFVLWVLRYAEFVTHGYVFGQDGDPLQARPLETCLMTFTGHGCAAEARRLARSFRLLAQDLRRQQQMEHRLRRSSARRQVRDQKFEKLFDIAGRPAFAPGTSAEAAASRASCIIWFPAPAQNTGTSISATHWHLQQAGFT